MKNKQRIKISVHPLTWILAAISFLTGQFLPFFILILIIMIHEFGHLAAALWFKWEIKSITLLPFGGKLEVNGILDRPIKEELIVVISGPIQHLFLGFICICFFQEWTYYSLFMMLNFQLLCFNLLPIWPLDGGRLLFLALAHFTSFRSAIKQSLLISGVGVGIAFIYSFWLFSFHLQWFLLLIYVGTSCVLQWKHRLMIERQFWLERIKFQHTTQVPSITLIHNQMNIHHLLSHLDRGSVIFFEIVAI